MKGLTIFGYLVQDVVRSKWIIVYMLFYAALSELFIRLGGDASRMVVSMLNVVIVLTPLVSVVFGTTYYYNSRDFIEVFLAQPIRRSVVFLSLAAALVLPLILALIVGVGAPAIIHGGAAAGPLLMLLTGGTFLTLTFTFVAMWISVASNDKLKGLSLSLLAWLATSLVYDGLMLIVVVVFDDYPLETPTLVMSMLNPVDLARIMVLLKTDIAVLMGYTGAVFERFFGTASGMITSFVAQIVWMLIPLGLGVRSFLRRDF
jgi:Cu-processing system permease protein